MNARRDLLMRCALLAAGCVGLPVQAACAGGQDLSSSGGQRGRVNPNVTIVEPTAFDWGSAALGAAGTFGLVVAVGGVVIVTRHGSETRREADRASSPRT